MNLKFKDEYLSIKSFDEIELEDFTILTGVNGSGKTHLLEALVQDKCQIDSILPKDIVFFDFIQFKIENEQAYNKEQITSERQGAWNYFITREGNNPPLIQHNLEKIKNKFLNEDEYKKIKDITQGKNKFLNELVDDDFENEELKNKFFNYKNDIREFFSQAPLQSNQQAQSILALSKKLYSFIDEISEIEFMNTYRPITLKENFLPMQLGKIFMDYRVKEYEEYHKNLEKSDSSADRNQLKILAQQKCKSLYAGSTPWEIINEFLNAYTYFRYTISFPEEFSTEAYIYNTRKPFMPELIDSDMDISVNYQDLSSGEQILFALALCLFKGKSDNIFPKLLLLDEIDAGLHPSMIGNLLHVIHEVLLKKGTKVILATHSPTTIALAPEKSIFVINKVGQKRVEKCTKKKALGILTEGYMTMEEGIKLFDQISKKELSIITEGDNTEYIKKAMEFFGNQNANKIDIIKGVEGRSGKTQLKTIFDFFTLANHDNKVVIVWDPECVEYANLKEKNNTYAFVLPLNLNHSITKKGIENLFDDGLFEPEDYTETKSGDVVLNREMNKKRKKAFMKRMFDNVSKDNFKNFKPLFEFIETKLSKNSS